MDVIVVGSGVGGLSSALMLARNGHRVTVLDQDPAPAAEDVEAAFDADRRGAPQVHQTHGFLARLVVELRRNLPDVLDALLAAGGVTMPTTADLGEPQPGDDDLRVIILRRTTLDWVLRQAALAEPSLDLVADRPVTGLLGAVATADAPAVVSGVRTAGADMVADAVVVASGRRSPLDTWLAELGVELDQTVIESGLMYVSRWYRTPPGTSIELDPKLGGDLGFVKYLAVPGDGNTVSVTLAIQSEDRLLRRALSEGDAFDEACRSLPGPDAVFADNDLTPIGDVRPMGALLNRRRRFLTDDGDPVALGLHAVGDAHTCTNPLYGRGCSLAAAQAALLAAADRDHPGDALRRARSYEQASIREVEPWFDVSVQMDRMGADPAGAAGLGNGDGKGLAAIFVAAATDPVIGRGLARFWNLMSTPAELMSDQAFLHRAMEVMADPDAYPVPPRVGPRRRDLLERLGHPDRDFESDTDAPTEAAS